MQRNDLISAIKAHADRFQIAPATITSRAVGNSRLFERLEAGGDCTTTIAAKIVEFIADDASRRSQGQLNASSGGV